MKIYRIIGMSKSVFRAGRVFNPEINLVWKGKYRPLMSYRIPPLPDADSLQQVIRNIWVR
ncbi:MAG TPA: hypothetical protein ENN63_08130 [Bacteroidetes bacterium]|nr:hypothetical protein [Bacteroidota bacterium]